jgi:predicted metal-binding membrane protein
MTHLSAETGPSAAFAGVTRIAGLLSRQRRIALVCMIVLAAAGWGWLLLVAMPQAPAGPAGFLDLICRAAPMGAAGGAGGAAAIGAMWVAMTLAMMLPTAGPMILTYAEIADTASRKGQPIVSPHVLIAGYVSVWFGFSIVATLAQLGVMSLAAWPGAASVAAPASAVLFLVAGLYQFSALKAACLRACQRPFSFFFLNWTDRPRGVFRLGVRQGLYCLGCCWAMMLLMFAAGAMNLVWMALLGLVMLIEKMTPSSLFSRLIGVAFVAVGLVLLAAWGSGLVSQSPGLVS